MSATAHVLGETFQPTQFDLGRNRSLRVAGVLEASSHLEEIPVVGDPANPIVAGAVGVRAFRVCAGLERLGLRKGDCLLIQTKERPDPADLVVIEVGDVRSAHRVVNRLGTRLQLDPPLAKAPAAADPSVLGVFAGILRKRLEADRVRPGAIPSADIGRPRARSRSAGTIRLLQGKLGMVESTCAGTSNPRLRRALRNEAESLRRQLQIEAASN